MIRILGVAARFTHKMLVFFTHFAWESRESRGRMPAPIDLSSKYGVKGAASAAQPQVCVPVRPVVERVRDYAILSGAVGGLVGACVSARHDVPMLRYSLAIGGVSGTLAGMFIGLRHALLQDRWEQDSEAISGFTAGALGMVTMTLLSPPKSRSMHHPKRRFVLAVDGRRATRRIAIGRRNRIVPSLLL